MASERLNPKATGKDYLLVQPGGVRQMCRKFKAAQPASDFDRAVEHIKQLPAPKAKPTRSGKKNASRKGVRDGE